MADQRKSARQRLVDAAFQLFSSQGVGTTTTRQVADLAGVNEVTLFRQFGSKHGLLAAVMTEAEVLTGSDTLNLAALVQLPPEPALRDFLIQCLDTLDPLSELVRSVIGEAGQFSAENSRALGQGLQTIRDIIAEHLDTLLAQGGHLRLPPETVAGLAIALLLGYTAIDDTAGGNAEGSPDSGPGYHGLWPSRTAFVDSLVSWLLSLRPGQAELALTAEPSSLATAPPNPETWIDLPAPVVHQIMQAARKASGQAYALVYVLLGSGVAAAEVPLLTRASAIYDSSQHILLIGPQHRQVPLNQWIMGRRYGTYAKNPLTRWLKSRSDDSPAMFLGPEGKPITAFRVRQLWTEVTADIISPLGTPLAIEQARATWCVEMLLKGLNRQELSLLSGLAVEHLDPLVQNAQARSALAQALRLDRPSGSGSGSGSLEAVVEPPAAMEDDD